MLLLALIIYLLNLFDLYATTMLVDKFGLEIEANPIGRFLLKDYRIAFLVKVVFTGISLAILYLLQAIFVFRLLMWLIFVVYALLTIYHMVIILYLKINKLWN